MTDVVFIVAVAVFSIKKILNYNEVFGE